MRKANKAKETHEPELEHFLWTRIIIDECQEFMQQYNYCMSTTSMIDKHLILNIDTLYNFNYKFKWIISSNPAFNISLVGITCGIAEDSIILHNTKENKFSDQ